MTGKYDAGLTKHPANYSALTPIRFLQRSATIYPDKLAVIDDHMSLTYRECYARVCQMAAALCDLGIGKGDTVSVLCMNTAELLEAHYFVPMSGAVLNALNTRLDAGAMQYILEHSEARMLIYDVEFEPLVRQVVQSLPVPPVLVCVSGGGGASDGLASMAYETLLASGRSDFVWQPPADEWDAISLNYTSGTTGRPKGVVYHHRGAYLAAMTNAMALRMGPETVYLWTLPMFHCNGWCYSWAVTAVGGTHVCLRRVVPADVLTKMLVHKVTHMCGAPVVLHSLINDFHGRDIVLESPVQFAVGGAAPHQVILSRAQEIGFDITHLYGLTESYGPSAVCVWQEPWGKLAIDGLAQKMARQGVSLHALDDLRVEDVEQGRPVKPDGVSMGELLMRGNTLMKGYLKDQDATDEAFDNGWFHTGDLAVMHPDGYVEVKDRLKDIIISGGENISSHEIEDVLYRHPMVLEAAVVALADEKWGEVPCAFVTLRDAASRISSEELIAFCREHMAGFKIPKKIVFDVLPKTSTGKIQKNVLRERLKHERE